MHPVFQSSRRDFTFGPWKLSAARTHIMKSAQAERWGGLRAGGAGGTGGTARHRGHGTAQQSTAEHSVCPRCSVKPGTTLSLLLGEPSRGCGLGPHSEGLWASGDSAKERQSVLRAGETLFAPVTRGTGVVPSLQACFSGWRNGGRLGYRRFPEFCFNDCSRQPTRKIKRHFFTRACSMRTRGNGFELKERRFRSDPRKEIPDCEDGESLE